MAHKKQTQAENAFKNWINPRTVEKWAQHIAKQSSSFNKKDFLKLSGELPNYELKGRVCLISDGFHEYINKDYVTALQVLLNASVKNKQQDLVTFELWPLTQFIQEHGTSHFVESTDALKIITTFFTGEFAIRPFIQTYPKESQKLLLQWSKDKNEHVRRLSSEGSRPRLPWGQVLHSVIKNPDYTLQILENLKYDESLYVRKSVSNHLNDISKDNPKIVLRLLKDWLKNAPKQHQEKIQWIAKQALRTLVKKGDSDALKTLGFNSKTDCKLLEFNLSKKLVHIGENLEFTFSVKSKKAENLVIDYIIHYNKFDGKTKPKVFKLKTFTISANQTLEIKKKHSFKPVTTRALYPGAHAIEIQINGIAQKKLSFTLT